MLALNVLNNMFDALNRKFPAEGIKEHSKDLEVIYVLQLRVYWLITFVF